MENCIKCRISGWLLAKFTVKNKGLHTSAFIIAFGTKNRIKLLDLQAYYRKTMLIFFVCVCVVYSLQVKLQKCFLNYLKILQKIQVF